MRKTHRKIVSGALLCGCALFTLYGASRIAERAENGALPTALTASSYTQKSSPRGAFPVIYNFPG